MDYQNVRQGSTLVLSPNEFVVKRAPDGEAKEEDEQFIYERLRRWLDHATTH